MRCRSDTWRWLAALEHICVDGQHEARTGAVESLLVVLSGTYDIFAGGGSWMARGVRPSPRDGKPVALFLPPNTPFRLEHGTGEILIASGVQPARVEAPGEASTKKPLLALAGSGKAFDPVSGEWKREEDFPSSPEAILPRRVWQSEVEGVVVRHVFPFDYKALCLCLDEVVLPADRSTVVPESQVSDYPREIALYYEAPGGLMVGDHEMRGQGFVEAVAPDARLVAGDQDAFLALVYAGPKLPA